MMKGGRGRRLSVVKATLVRDVGRTIPLLHRRRRSTTAGRSLMARRNRSNGHHLGVSICSPRSASSGSTGLGRSSRRRRTAVESEVSSEWCSVTGKRLTGPPQLARNDPQLQQHRACPQGSDKRMNEEAPPQVAEDRGRPSDHRSDPSWAEELDGHRSRELHQEAVEAVHRCSAEAELRRSWEVDPSAGEEGRCGLEEGGQSKDGEAVKEYDRELAK